MNNASARLFLALCPPPAVQEALAVHECAWRWPAEARRYAPADLHVTLHFLGAVPRERLAELGAGLDVRMSPFTLRWGQPLLWPHGLAVLLPEAVPPALARLYEALGQALHGLGLPTETRAFRPHLTLARHAERAVPPLPPGFDWPVDGYALMESTGDPAQRYRVLRAYGAST